MGISSLFPARGSRSDHQSPCPEARNQTEDASASCWRTSCLFETACSIARRRSCHLDRRRYTSLCPALCHLSSGHRQISTVSIETRCSGSAAVDCLPEEDIRDRERPQPGSHFRGDERDRMASRFHHCNRRSLVGTSLPASGRYHNHTEGVGHPNYFRATGNPQLTGLLPVGRQTIPNRRILCRSGYNGAHRWPLPLAVNSARMKFNRR